MTDENMYTHNLNMVFCNAIILHTALTFKGGEVVVMEAFGAHFMKDVSRGQLTSAAKSLLSSRGKALLVWAEKRATLYPLWQKSSSTAK